MEIRTARLTLRGWRDEDLDDLAALDADPEVMRYIGNGSTRDRQQSAEALAAFRRQWDENGFGLFAVDVTDSGAFAGWVGLAIPRFLPEIMPTVEIGWRLAPAHWGRGYATEAATAVLGFAFDDRRLDRLHSVRHVDNAASGRVMDKLGFEFDRRTTVPASGAPVIVTVLTTEQHDARRRGR